MTIATFPHPHQQFIDTAPFAARYAVLTQAVMSYLAAGQYGRMLRASQAVLRLVRAFTKIDAQNILLRRKHAMLADKAWRERVLSDLGGLRKLFLWDAAHKRHIDGVKPKYIRNEDVMQPWCFTPERLAESERLKAHARKCARASIHPRIMRNRVKTDFDGLFRLAPLPRGPQATRRVKVYTQYSISEYDWNPIPFAKDTGFGPATVWPMEFYAAMAVEAESTEPFSMPCHPAQERSSQMGDHASETPTSQLIPQLRRKRLVRDDSILAPLHIALTRASYRAIFENPV